MVKRFDGEFDQVEILSKKAVEAQKGMEFFSKKAAEAQKELDQALIKLNRTRDGYRTLAAVFDEAENDLNRGVRNFHQLVVFTAVATGVSCGFS